MEKFKKIMVLAVSALLLAGCGESSSEDNSSDSSSDDSAPLTVDWSADDKALLERYCGEVLPYPASIGSNVNVVEIEDEYSGNYLQIYAKSSVFTIADYYKDLEKASWNVVKNYNGGAVQIDSYGAEYYEAVKVSGDKGYDIQYSYAEDSAGNKYNLIACYNDLGVETTNATNWTNTEIETFGEAIGAVPTMLKLGSEYAVYSDNYAAVVYDDLAIDYTLENVEALKQNGWALDEENSTQSGCYILTAETPDGGKIGATLYYSAGNYAVFECLYDVYESLTWPSEFVATFEKVSGTSIPEFHADDIEKYYYFIARGEFNIYAYTESESVSDDYTAKIKNIGGIYDAMMQQYMDWDQTWYAEIKETTDSNYNSIFQVTFAALAEPVDEILSSYPTDAINEFLTRNDMADVEIPPFEYLIDYSGKDTAHAYYIDYEDAYSYAYQEVSEDCNYYNIDDPTDVEAIKAVAEKLATENTIYTISVYDKAVASDWDEEAEPTNEAYDYLASALSDSNWVRVSGDSYDLAYEDPTGKVMIGLKLANDVTSVTFTHGSGKEHKEVKFAFYENNLTIEAGGTCQLQLICEGVTGTVEYSSDNDKFTVDDNGLVTAAEDASGEATITASILPDGATEPLVATAIVSVDEIWTPQKAAETIASKFNAYFDLTASDDNYATANANGDDSYSLTMHSDSITTIEAAETLFTFELIPGSTFGDIYDGEWQDGSFDEGDLNGTTNKYLDYVAYNNDDTEVDFTVFVYTVEGNVYIKVNVVWCE